MVKFFHQATVGALLLLIAVPVFQLPLRSAMGQSSREFRWVDSRTDARLFTAVKRAFAKELQPDDPAKVAPYVADRFKYIARIGVYGSSAIVMVGERENESDKTGDYFQGYNYDLKSGQKSKVLGFGGRAWQFLRLSNFGDSPLPDVVFQYFDCTECEATLLLGSFRYDASTMTWHVRMWSPKDSSLEIGSDNQFGDDGIYAYRCIHRIGDFSGDGFDQVIVWCRETNLDKHKSDDWTQFYSVKHKPPLASVSDPTELQRLHTIVCVTNRSSKLCQPK